MFYLMFANSEIVGTNLVIHSLYTPRNMCIKGSSYSTLYFFIFSKKIVNRKLSHHYDLMNGH